MSKKCLLTIFFFIGSSLWSSFLSAKEFPRVYRSAYFLGRGDTGISVADNEDAIFYNPAGIAYGKGIYKKTVLLSPTIEVSSSTRDMGRRLGVEENSPIETFRENVGKPQHLGIYNFTGVILRRAALGIFASGNANLMVSKSKEAGALEMGEADLQENAGATFSLADSIFSENFFVGTTIKYLNHGQAGVSVNASEIDQVNDIESDDLWGHGYGTGFDVGMMYRPSSGRALPSIGLTVENIGDTRIVPEKDAPVLENIKQTINLGLGIEVKAVYSGFRFLVDYRDIASRVETNTFKKVHLGGELTIRDYIGFTGGLNQGYASGGVYLDVRFIRFDFGAYTEEIGDYAGARPDNRLFFRLLAGF